MTSEQPAHLMWAPWRMAYFRAPKEKGCFLCRIIQEGPENAAGNLVLHRGETCLLLMNRYPYNVGHLMVAPLRHAGVLAALAPEEMRDMMAMACLGERLLERVAQPHGFNLGINQGSAAGAGLKDHLHLHVVPRWDGDTNFMPVLGRTRVMPQALDELYAGLKAALDQEAP